METIDKNLYYKKFAQVTVNGMIMSNTSKCNECEDSLQEFTVFVGEDQRLSTMFSSCCGNCLPIVVKKAIIDGRKTAEDQITRAEQRLYNESLALIRKTKLERLEGLK